MKLPQELGPIHFVGIGGIGMSGIAEVLANLGYTVQGSDVAESANVKRLREAGIKVAIGHDARNLDGLIRVMETSPNASEVAGRNHPGPIHLQAIVAGISKMMYEM